MKKKKVSLKNLKITSFITDAKFDFNNETVKGGTGTGIPCGEEQPFYTAGGNPCIVSVNIDCLTPPTRVLLECL